jgi:regulation of enolase protein 1 (concanavalin A-like superfamily)
MAAFCAVTVNAATAHVASGPLNINGQNGTVYENLHVTSTSGPCVTITNSTNITFHNMEVGPCNSSDANSTYNGQALVITGGSGIKILDSYIHAESPGIVNRTNNQTTFDVGDNIMCNDSTNVLIQGNVIAWGQSNIETGANGPACPGLKVIGNFLLNPIDSLNTWYRGQQVAMGNGGHDILVDRNYSLASTDTSKWKYAANSSDMIAAGGNGGNSIDGLTVTNNYVTGGTFAWGCGIIMDGGMNSETYSKTTTISNNVLVDSGVCGISVEGGYNYTISGNKVMNRNTGLANNNQAFEVFQLYSFYGCGNVTLTNNLGYAINTTGYISGMWYGGGCTNVTGATSGSNGNVYDYAPYGAAYNAMNPPETVLPAPMIPPVPYSCAVVSPFTNNTAASCAGGPPPPPPPSAPTISLAQPVSATTLTGITSLSATASSGVTSVSYFLNGTTLGQTTTSPWNLSLDTTKIANGTYSLTAVATQSGFPNATSDPVLVTIQNTVVSKDPPATGQPNSSLWTVVTPAGGSATTNGSKLFLTVPGGSNHDPAFGGVNNSVRVMEKTGNVDFTLETKFDSIPGSQYQFEGVLIQQDPDSYLRFQFGSTGSILVVGVDTIISKVQTSMFSPAITIPAGASSLWMRVKRSGNSWTQSWSADGKTYTTVGSFTQALTVTSVGPFAGNYNNDASQAPAFTSVIDYFNNIAPVAPAGIVSDNFNMSPVPATGGMNTNIWTMIAPAGGTYKMSGTELLMTAPAGSNHDPAFGGANNSVRVMQTTGNADFAIEVKFNSIPKLGYQFEGILVGQDASNYLRFQFGSTGSILVVGADVIAAKADSAMFSPVISIPAKTASLWMRVVKSGNTWTQTWSADGKTYNAAGSFTQPLNVTSVGPFVGNYNGTPSAAPGFTSKVDYFINTTPLAPGGPTSDNFNQ